MTKKGEERFVTIYSKGFGDGNKIMVDKETGVHYLYSWYGQTGGITPLLDTNGKVVVNLDVLKEK